jgi:hypothetical protein
MILSLSEPSSTEQKTHTIDLFRDNIKNLLSRVNPALARGYFDDKMTKVQLLAFAHARAAVECVMNQAKSKVEEPKTIIQQIVEFVLNSCSDKIYELSNTSTSIPPVRPENELKRATGEVSFHDWLIDQILEKNKKVSQGKAEKVYLFLFNVKDIDTKDMFLKADLEGKIDYDLVGFTEGVWATVKNIQELENKMPKKINKTCWPF